MILKKLLTIPLLLLLLVNTSFSQHTPKKITAKELNSGKYNYAANTVIFKIKPQYIQEFVTNKEKTSAFQKNLDSVKIISIEKLIPNAEPPGDKKNKYGKPHTDISSIYLLKYSSSQTVAKVIDLIESTGMVYYAEPMFSFKVEYVPNDPGVQPTAPANATEYFYLSRIKAFEAWDVEKGDTNVVMGIIDTGTWKEHPDLKNKIKYNYAEPINNKDDDNDGYIDNRYGWDLADNDNNPDYDSVNGYNHGSLVSGCASAQPDNGIGVVGTGYNCKFLPIKASSGDAIIDGYQGILYAVTHKCKVINLSWGGTGAYSSSLQEVINVAALDSDAVVLAAAGNDGKNEIFYPASFDNIMSVAASDTLNSSTYPDSTIDIKAYFSNYNYRVDICAQGKNTYTTVGPYGYGAGNGYTINSGTSFSTPIVAGAAALVRSKFPAYNSQQVIQQLRVTADDIYALPENSAYNEMLGKGRLNMYRALTETNWPSVRQYSFSESDKFGNYAFAGDTIEIISHLRNYLAATTNLTVTISAVGSTASDVTIVNGVATYGIISTMDSAMNSSNPFIIYISPNAAINEEITFRLGFSDGAYTDYQYFNMYVNPSYLDLNVNDIKVTIAGSSTVGFTSDSIVSPALGVNLLGDGFVYKGAQLLSEAGLMVSDTITRVSNNTRDSASYYFEYYDHDFTATSSARYLSPQKGAAQEALSVFSDAHAKNPVNVNIQQRSFEYANSPYNKFVIVEYKITNNSGKKLDTLYTGIFADWDIGQVTDNKADWDGTHNLGYIYEAIINGMYAGISLLTDNTPSYYALDNTDTEVAANNINPNDIFTYVQKYQTLSKGVFRTQAGVEGGGNDVSFVIGGALYNVAPGEVKTVAYAFIAGDDLTDLQASADAAEKIYRQYNTSATPLTQNLTYCTGDTVNATVIPSNGNTFNFYNSLPLATPVYTGSSYTLVDDSKPDTIYVTGADSVFESPYVPVYVNFDSINVNFTYAADPSTGEVFFVNQSQSPNQRQQAIQLNWNLGDSTSSNASAFTHQYSAPGTYNVTLVASNTMGCKDSITQAVQIASVTGVLPSALNGRLTVYPNPVTDVLTVTLALTSQQNVSVSVINAVGNEVYSGQLGNVSNNQFQINMAGQPSGFYLLRIGAENSEITKKFIKQ